MEIAVFREVFGKIVESAPLAIIKVNAHPARLALTAKVRTFALAA